MDVAAFAVALVGAPLARRSPRATLAVCFPATAASLLWLARTPVPAHYVLDLLLPLAVLGVSLTTVFIVTTHLAVADVAEGDKGLASGIFETANHLIGGAIGVAVYATVLTSISDGAGDPDGFRGAFLAAVVLVAVLGSFAVSQARTRATPSE
ncbi:hypothetical protein B0I31_117124 [Saccharothrix carnea]|uniref:MFS transporter n=1 Tax=Saccharothrix carnea TaxID=1280637 RepID=A0A2P8I0D7_SACCR|nr:hypothetical protein [Saccharothrix carnea]PSL51921.1 hypothetical protein B0I31_117124 [Saccharothrix carnea]